MWGLLRLALIIQFVDYLPYEIIQCKLLAVYKLNVYVHRLVCMFELIQVLDSSLQFQGEEMEGVKTELQTTRDELSEVHKTIVAANEEKEQLQQELEDIKHKFNVSEVKTPMLPYEASFVTRKYTL